jgi:copper chaperone CopZ
VKPSVWNTVPWIAAVVLVGLGAPWLAAQMRDLPERGSLAGRSGERVVTLEVGGMTCESCVATVQGRLVEVPGVSAAEVRLAQERAYVVCAPSLPDSVLIDTIHRAGPGFLATVVAR